MDKLTIAATVMASFKGELEAFKPGNVSFYADGHNMTVQDFLISAELSVPILCESGQSVGQRIVNSVKATREAVGCNTNLGMLLLFCPVIVAAESNFNSEDELRYRLGTILNSLTIEDTGKVFEAICIANPGGLGKVEKYDVRQPTPFCSLIEAMQSASERDFIAMQYVTNYRDIFQSGLANIKYFVRRWNSLKWSTVACFMAYLSSIRDSHIERKHGRDVAEQIKAKSKIVAKKFNSSANPESCIELLQDFDEELKSKKYNPGTSADLTATALLVYNLIYN